MKKTRKPKMVAFSIDEDVLNKFLNFCKDNSYNRSQLIERLIKSYLKAEGVLNE